MEMGAGYDGVLVSRLEEVGIILGPSDEGRPGCTLLDPRSLASWQRRAL